jgi:hypothetical protein
MRIKFIKVNEQGLETRGKKAAGKVSRAVTGHVVTPAGGKVGKDDNPAKPTKKLKAMVRRSYKAKAENSSTEILGDRIVEGFNGILEATAKGVTSAAKKRKGSFTKTGYNPKSGENEDTTHVPGKRSRTTVAEVPGGVMVGREGKKGYRTRKVSDSTEILGDKTVEKFNNLLSELSTKTLKSYQGKAIGQMRQGKKSGLSGAKMAKRGKMIHKAGEKIKAQSGDQKEGEFKRSEKEKLTGKPKKG